MSKWDDELAGYSPGEVEYIIQLMAAMKPFDEIQRLFLDFTASLKGISRKTIHAVGEKYKRQIKEQNKAYLANELENPLAHRRIRMDIAYKILLDCMTPRPINSIKVEDGSYQVVEKAENATALSALKLVMQDLEKKEELKLLAEKIRGKSNTETPVIAQWEIEEGLDVEDTDGLPERTAEETEV